jgi:DNA-binding response OmpR family regulator
VTTSILLIEDDEDLRDVLVDVLEDKGFSVMGVGSADEAIKAQSHFEFDVVVSDVRMAGSHDGIGAVEVLKKKKPGLKCLIITGFADDQAPVRALRVKVDDYLYKPFTLEEFLVAVNKVIRSGEERSSLKHRLGALFSAPFKAVNDSVRNAAQDRLDEKVDQVWTNLYVAIRSRLLTKGAFVDFWDKLENGRTRYLAVNTSGVGAGELNALTQAYDVLLQQLEKSTAMRAAGTHKARNPEQFPKKNLMELYERVADGRVSSEELRLSLAVAAKASGSEAQQLAMKLFGVAS